MPPLLSSPDGGRLATGTQLSTARKAAGLTQAELARLAGVPTGTIRRLEKAGRRWIVCAYMDEIESALMMRGVEPVRVNDKLGVLWQR
jgi:transcriptional regulator with XRE-family HTH domain